MGLKFIVVYSNERPSTTYVLMLFLCIQVLRRPQQTPSEYFTINLKPSGKSLKLNIFVSNANKYSGIHKTDCFPPISCPTYFEITPYEFFEEDYDPIIAKEIYHKLNDHENGAEKFYNGLKRVKKEHLEALLQVLGDI